MDLSLSTLCVFSQSEAIPVYSDYVMCGFLLYGDNPKTRQQMWSVVTRSEPVLLHLYTAPRVGITVMKNNVTVTVAFYFQTLEFLCHVLVSVCVSLFFGRDRLYTKCIWCSHHSHAPSNTQHNSHHLQSCTRMGER